jgi:hypothetical protein
MIVKAEQVACKNTAMLKNKISEYNIEPDQPWQSWIGGGYE